MFAHIVGSIFAVVGIVLYAIDLSNASVTWMCEGNRQNADDNGDNCRNVADYAQVSIYLSIYLSIYITYIYRERGTERKRERGRERYTYDT